MNLPESNPPPPLGNEKTFKTWLPQKIGEGPVMLLILDGLQDPHNLGACLRTAECAGVNGVILTKDRSAPMSAVVRKVAKGAAERLSLFQVTNLARVLRFLKEEGVWLYGTSLKATHSIYTTDFKGNVALVMGSEGEGMRRLTAELCDDLLLIPMIGETECLNVSVATGVCLFEMVRQRISY